MTFLISYYTSAISAPSLLRAQEMQKAFPIPKGFSRVVFSDVPIDGLPADMELVVEPSLSGHGGYWHGRTRNLALAHARKLGVDYLIALDSDMVWMGFDEIPASDFEYINVFRQRELEAITAEVLADESRWTTGSWWIYSKALMNQPWCESYDGFIGYGFDDYDFIFNVMKPHGVEPKKGGAKAIHLWHPQDRGEDVGAEIARNKRLFEGRQAANYRS